MRDDRFSKQEILNIPLYNWEWGTIRSRVKIGGVTKYFVNKLNNKGNIVLIRTDFLLPLP